MKIGTTRLTCLLAMVGLCLALLTHFQVPTSQSPGDPLVKSFSFEAAWRKSDRTLVPEELVEDKGTPCHSSSSDPLSCYRLHTTKPASHADAILCLDHLRLARAPPSHAS